MGRDVKRGQPLLEIYSPELVATQEELLLAARYRDATSRSPFADVSEGGASLYAATRRRLGLWDIPERDIERVVRHESKHRADHLAGRPVTESAAEAFEELPRPFQQPVVIVTPQPRRVVYAGGAI